MSYVNLITTNNMKCKLYKLGRSKRLAIMLPKEAVYESGDYEVQIGEKIISPETVSQEQTIITPQENGNPETTNSV